MTNPTPRTAAGQWLVGMRAFHPEVCSIHDGDETRVCNCSLPGTVVDIEAEAALAMAEAATPDTGLRAALTMALAAVTDTDRNTRDDGGDCRECGYHGGFNHDDPDCSFATLNLARNELLVALAITPSPAPLDDWKDTLREWDRQQVEAEDPH